MTLLSLKFAVITASGFLPPYWLLDTIWYNNMIVLESALNEATFEVLYNALMVTKTQWSQGCVSGR